MKLMSRVDWFTCVPCSLRK
nr:TPA_asm: m100.5 sORF 1 [Murid betaherpesvirus 1]DBA07871.1 TPA_asm: m100.5 sORF 1 [Murid betaherpesvirus 1]